MTRMTICAATAALAALAAPADEKTVAFVCGHPDDLAAQVGLALLLKDEGCDIHVIDYTHGERGCGEEKFTNGWTRATRTKEEESVCDAVGAKLHWLEEIDGEALISRETVDSLSKLFSEIKPRAVFLHWPVDTHNDHSTSTIAAMRALEFARLRPEIYYNEQDFQSRNFVPSYFVDVSSVAEKKKEIIAKYVCQEGEEIAKRKETSTVSRGRQCGFYKAPAEAYAVMHGTVTPGKGLLDCLEKTRVTH